MTPCHRIAPRTPTLNSEVRRGLHPKNLSVGLGAGALGGGLTWAAGWHGSAVLAGVLVFLLVTLFHVAAHGYLGWRIQRGMAALDAGDHARARLAVHRAPARHGALRSAGRSAPGPGRTGVAAMNDRVLFSVAAIFNFSVALGLVLPGSPVWTLLHMAPRAPDVFLHLLALFIAIFGGVYVAGARKPQGKRPLVQLAIAGKLAVFAVVLLHFFAGTISLQLPLLASGDFVFAILFMRALKRMA